jgi:transketolase
MSVTDSKKLTNNSPAMTGGPSCVPLKPLTVGEMSGLTRKLRREIVTMIGKAGSGHPGGSLSAVDIMAVLYFNIMRHCPGNPKWPERDRFVLSKGHAAPALYAVLAEAGYFPVEELSTLRQLDSRLQGHADATTTPGVEMSAGALGQGLSFAIGVCLAGRLDRKDYHVYCLLGDGELNEGQVWEAAAAAAHYKTDKLIAIVDSNRFQIDGACVDVMSMQPLGKKWESFGWKVTEVDGHDLNALVTAINQAKMTTGQPACIIAHTVKGKGVSFMENNPDFHGKAPNAKELEIALKELA